MESAKDFILKNIRITKKQLDNFLGIQKKKGVSLRRILVEEGVASEEELSALISRRIYMPVVYLESFKLDPALVDLFPEYMARIYSAVPLSKTVNKFIIATSEPLNILALDDLKAFSGFDVFLVYSSEDKIRRGIEALYGKGSKELLGQEPAQPSPLNQGPIEKLVDIVLAHALSKKASDVHIEPEPECVRIRYRVDGSLQDILKVPKLNQNSILARLKMISDFDITENRIPQDGKFRVKVDGQEVGVRVSSLPTAFGQKFVLHILDKTMIYDDLAALGFSDENSAVFKSALTRRSGMILFCGPVDSGKTTTAYSVLNQLNSASEDIVTIEEPVEHQIGGITQVQARPDSGLDFAACLRSILRQNPNIVMIDRINDAQTADAAVKAGLSGQLVLAIVQCADAVSGLARILEMGIEPYLIASSLVMLCSQRLARKTCLKCRRPVELPREQLEKNGFSGKGKFYAAAGCKYCNYTGSYGRTAVTETLLIDEHIRDIIIHRKPCEDIRRYALKCPGFKNLREDAYLKVREGLISLDEAIRITTEGQ